MVLPCGSNTDGFSVTKTRARMQIPLRRSTQSSLRAQRRAGLLRGLCGFCGQCRAKDAIEDVIDVLQLLVEVERPLDLGGGQQARDVRVRQEQRLEIAVLVEGSHRVSLYPVVRLLPRDAFLR